MIDVTLCIFCRRKASARESVMLRIVIKNMPESQVRAHKWCCDKRGIKYDSEDPITTHDKDSRHPSRHE